MLIVLGKISVPVPGTPVQITETAIYQAAGNSRFQTCQAVLLQAWHLNTGAVYVGKVGMVKASGAAVAAVLPIPAASAVGSWGASNHLSPAGIDLSSLYIDADDANDGALVTLLVT